MKVQRYFTREGESPYSRINFVQKSSEIKDPDGTTVFKLEDIEVPEGWSQVAIDILAQKYFRKAGVPLEDEHGNRITNPDGTQKTGTERSARQVFHRLADCWRSWGEAHGYFDDGADAQAFYDELVYMLASQYAAPNSPQWFNTGLYHSYGISGVPQGHYFVDPTTHTLTESKNAYEHPQPHACFIQSISDDLVNEGGIMDLWVREARLFKYGSGTGTRTSRQIARGGRAAVRRWHVPPGLMSFLKIGDRAAGAIKSGGTTRRAAKMVTPGPGSPGHCGSVSSSWKAVEEQQGGRVGGGLDV